MSANPENLRYAESHEWVRIDGTVAVVGITDYAQHALGDIVYVDLPEVGDTVEAGSEFGAVESVKAASDLLSPVTGEVIEVNEDLEDDPGLINKDAFGTWIMKVQVDDPSQIDSLLDAEAYGKLCAED